MKCPPNVGLDFYNYKHFFSSVYLAVVGPLYWFFCIDISCQTEHPKYPNFEVPNAAIDYFFVCDNAFPLAKHLMKPYPSRNLSEERQLFNYRLSRARRISENVFGLLASRFHVFHTMMM
jgi:hypothetical protein